MLRVGVSDCVRLGVTEGVAAPLSDWEGVEERLGVFEDVSL